MERIFSQKIKKDNFEIVYNCSINTENSNIVFTHINEHQTGTQVISFMFIDFPTIREFINNGKIDYEDNNYKFIENENHFQIYNKKDDIYISLPKTFLFDSYNVLNIMWVED